MLHKQCHIFDVGVCHINIINKKTSGFFMQSLSSVHRMVLLFMMLRKFPHIHPVLFEHSWTTYFQVILAFGVCGSKRLLSSCI